ncbi:MAG: hypothetical protein M4579_004149 [Chaenotheca gracillima]|nr:MAG: hypothetical protein M4579_004149 [Chaenotheca gracillima]
MEMPMSLTDRVNLRFSNFQRCVIIGKDPRVAIPFFSLVLLIIESPRLISYENIEASAIQIWQIVSLTFPELVEDFVGSVLPVWHNIEMSVNGRGPTHFNMCIRLKHAHTTVFLVKNPHETFDDLRAALLDLLTERFPNGQFHGEQLPTSIDQLVLGSPRNPQDLQQGWDAFHGIDYATTTLTDYNVKDGSVLAFGFALTGFPPLIDDDMFNIRIPTYEETYDNVPQPDSPS